MSQLAPSSHRHTWRTRGLALLAASGLLASSSLSAALTSVAQAASPSASPYPAAVLADQPAVYYRLGDAAGAASLADASGHNNPAAPSGGLSLGLAGPLAGDPDTAAALDGTAALRSASPLAIGDNFTIEAWVKPTSASASGTLVGLLGSSGSRTLELSAGQLIGMGAIGSTWPSLSVFGPKLSPAWHYVAFVSQGPQLSLYVDGAQAASTTLAAARPSFSANAVLGASDAAWLPKLSGALDEVALYPAALSPSQVQAHFAASQPAPAPAPTPSQPTCPASLQALVDAAAPNSTVSVPACVFRETVTIDKPLTLAGQPGAEIRGSDVWSTFSPSGSTFVSQQSVPSLPTVSLDKSACADSTNRCLWSEQVFVDGQELHQVATGTTPATGQFALDGSRHVVLADNPSGHTVEVTTRSSWIVTQADGVTIQGFSMRHAANSAVRGAVSNYGHSNFTLQNSSLAYAHAANVSMDGGSTVKVLDNDVAFGGLNGIAGSGITQGGLVQRNKVHDNRTAEAGFSQNWGAAGIKLTSIQTFTVDSNEVASNNGVGLWCDIGCTSVTLSNNRVHHNAWQGINFEVSDGASIHDNMLWENGWGKQSWGWGAGIVISSSANAEVYNNTLAWNYAGISIIAQNRPDAVKSTGISVHDNTIAKKIVTGDFSATYWKNLSLAWLSDSTATQYLYDPASNNRGSNNHFWYDLPEGQPIRFTWLYAYSNLSRFTPKPGGAGSTYLSTADMTAALTAKTMPTTAEPH